MRNILISNFITSQTTQIMLGLMNKRKQCKLEEEHNVDKAAKRAVEQMRYPEILLSPRAGVLCGNIPKIPLSFLPGACREESPGRFGDSKLQHRSPAEEEKVVGEE